jgi:hypothetical protein
MAAEAAAVVADLLVLVQVQGVLEAMASSSSFTEILIE